MSKLIVFFCNSAWEPKIKPAVLEIFAAVQLKIPLEQEVVGFRRFEGPYCLHCEGKISSKYQ
jgi:hypothetical protein